MHKLEEKLFARYRASGDPGVLGEIYDLVAPELLHVALHLAGCPADAEDLLQATLLAAIEKAETWDATRPLRPWLLGILANQAKLARWRDGRRPDPERVTMREAPIPEDAACGRELREKLDEALIGLPPHLQPVLILRLEHGLTAVEIAHALRRPPGTVRAQLQRGVEALRRRLPASYAGAALAFLDRPARGLAVVREAVLAEALALEAPALTLASVAGLLTMKKTLIAVLATGMLVTVWAVLPENPIATPTTARPRGMLADTVAPHPSSLAPPPEENGGGRVEVTKPRSEEPALVTVQAREHATGTLTIQAHWLPGGEPAAGAMAVIDIFGSKLPYPDRRVVQTNRDGEARLDVPSGHTYVRLLRGFEDGVTVPSGEAVTLSLGIPAGITVVGEVVDDLGRGVPGAEIWLSERLYHHRGHALMRADDAGRFEMRSVHPDNSIAARAPGYATSNVQAVSGKIGEAVEVRIALSRRGAQTHGRVVDASGDPVPDAELLVGVELPDPAKSLADGRQTWGPPPQWTRTDAKGGFRLDSVPLGAVPIQVRAPDLAPVLGELRIDEGRDVPVEIVLQPGARVVGHVTNAGGGPVGGVFVHGGPVGRFATATTYSRTDGSFALAGLGSGRNHVEASSPNGGRAESQLDLESGRTFRWNPVLEGVLRIHGVLLDAEGKPLDGWQLVAQAETPEGEHYRSGLTDARGRFSLAGVADAGHTLWIQAPGAWREFPRRVLVGIRPSPDSLIVELDDDRETGTITAVVVDLGGRPVTSAQIEVWHEGQRTGRSFPVDAETGSIRIDHVPPGTCSLEVRSQTHPWARLGSHPVEAGRTLDLGMIELADPGYLVGDLVGVGEESLETLVFILADAKNRQGGIVQLTGRTFRSSPLAPGEYTLSVTGDFVAGKRIELAIEAGMENHQTIELEPAGVRRVIFERPPAASMPHAMWCSVRDLRGGQVWLRGNILARDGKLEARVSLPPGEYRLVAETNNGLRAEGAFSIHGYSGSEDPLRYMLFVAQEE